MKKIFLTQILALATIICLHATIRTVSNNTASPGQYSNLQTAVNSSAVGDTLYVQGSPTSYGDVTINKKLTLIGAGYAPDSIDFLLSTMVNQLIFDSVFPNIISGSKIVGFTVISNLTFASGDVGFVHDVTFERTLFYYYNNISGNNWSFLNCVFDGEYIDINTYNNILFTNCFFVGTYLYDSNKNSVNIYNSIFINYTSTMFSTVSNMGIYNSIFWNNAIHTCTNCLFMNDITFDDVARDLPVGNGNLSNTDPQFSSTLPSTTTTIPYTDLKKYNWNLKNGSPGHNAGTDGKDIGLYGGSMPYVNLTGMYPQIPVIKSFIIKNPVAQKNGSLNIQVKAEKKQ